MVDLFKYLFFLQIPRIWIGLTKRMTLLSVERERGDLTRAKLLDQYEAVRGGVEDQH